MAPPDLALFPTLPVSVLDQLLTGDHAGGRRVFIGTAGPSIGRDMAIVFAPERFTFVTLRPRLTDGPDPVDEARARLAMHSMAIIGALLTPGPQDDLAVMGVEVAGAGAGAGGWRYRDRHS